MIEDHVTALQGVRREDAGALALALAVELLASLRRKGTLTEGEAAGVVLTALHGTAQQTLHRRAGDRPAERDIFDAGDLLEAMGHRAGGLP